MKFIHFTDLHLTKAGEDSHGVDVWQNTRDLIANLQHKKADFAVLTGDISFGHGDLRTYKRTRTLFQKLPYPVYFIPGNHDNAEEMSEVFHLPISNGEIYYEKKMEDRSLLFLDTSNGHMSSNQLEWLFNTIRGKDETPPILFMHHPPVFCGVPYMDMNHPFRDDELKEILISSGYKQLHIFCGHYHVHKVVFHKNLIIHITPSTFFQIEDRTDSFQVAHYRFGYCSVVADKMNFRTSVYYLEGNMLPSKG